MPSAFSFSSSSSSSSSSSASPAQAIHCRQWVFDTHYFRSTLVTEFNLVCGNASKPQLIEMLYFAGSAFGMLVGTLGDSMGRRNAILTCAAWEVIISLMTPLVTNLNLIIVLRFLRGFSISIFHQGYALLSELVPMQRRAVFVGNFWVFWPLGFLAACGLAFATRDWRTMRLCMSATQLVYVSYIFLIPESPRWLTTQGRRREAMEVLAKLAKYNGNQLDAEDLRGIAVANEEESPDCCEMFRGKQMLTRTLLFWFVMSSFSVGYFGLATKQDFASSNIFLNMFLLGFVELFSGPLAWLLSEHINRKVPLCAMSLLCAGAVLAVPFLKHNFPTLPLIGTTVALFGKFLLTSCYILADLCMLEIFPTSIRNTGAFTATMWAQIATIITPYFNHLSEHLFYSTGLIIASSVGLSGVLIWVILPETKNVPMPQTMDDAEALQRGKEGEFRDMILSNMRLNASIGEEETVT